MIMRKSCRAKNIDWDKQLLGQKPDQKIAKALGVSPAAVCKARKRRGIPRYKPRDTVNKAGRSRRKKNVDWDKQPLGKKTDQEIAEALGVTSTSVWQARKARGIPAHRDQKVINWDAQGLGKASDNKIAKRLGVSVATVRYHREKREIPSHRAKVFKYRKRNINWDKQPLGQVTDYALAKKLGVAWSSVRRQRTIRGIKPATPAPRRVFINWDEQPLGKMRDEDLAIELGVAKVTVGAVRRSRGIPRYSEVAAVLEGRRHEDAESLVTRSRVSTTKEFEVTIQVRNNRLKQRRLELGHETIRSFAQAAGISKTAYSELERMVRTPKGFNGEWRPLVLKVAEFHGCSPDELFPPAVMKARKRALVFRIDEDEVKPLLEANMEPPKLQDEIVAQGELEEEVERVLKTLTPREERVMRQRFGLGENELTFDEIAEGEEVTSERIRQIEAKALRKLRHPSRSSSLRSFLEDSDLEDERDHSQSEQQGVELDQQPAEPKHLFGRLTGVVFKKNTLVKVRCLKCGETLVLNEKRVKELQENPYAKLGPNFPLGSPHINLKTYVFCEGTFGFEEITWKNDADVFL